MGDGRKFQFNGHVDLFNLLRMKGIDVDVCHLRYSKSTHVKGNCNTKAKTPNVTIVCTVSHEQGHIHNNNNSIIVSPG